MVTRLEIELRPDLKDPRGEEVAHKVRTYLGLSTGEVRTRDVYRIDARLCDDEPQRILHELVDPTLQRGAIGRLAGDDFDVAVHVGYKPGVTDPVAKSARIAIEDTLGRTLGADAAVFTSRLFLFRGDIRQEMNHYHQRGELIITSYVRGVNAYIEETERNPELLPLEFRLLGIRPGKWTPETVISRHQGLLGNIGTELSIARAVAAVGAEEVNDLLSFSPANPNLEIDSAIDRELLFDDILGTYNAFRRPVRFRPEDLAEEYREDGDKLELLDAATAEYNELQSFGQEEIGSNNWVVSGDRTQNRFPIMANDPHRAHSAPSLRY